jgi:hypothetical protein
VYGIDVVLERGGEGGGRMRPYLLEVTYQPDMRKALTEHPDFLNDVFSTLLLDEPPEGQVRRVL